MASLGPQLTRGAAAPAAAPRTRTPAAPAPQPWPCSCRRRPLLAGPVRAQQQQQPGSNAAAEDLGRQAQEFVRSTSRRVGDFVRETELDKKAAAAYEDASQQLRTSYARLDAEFDLAGRLSSLQGRITEQTRDIDQSLGLRRRARVALEDVRRLAPTWARRAREFSSTTAGKVALTAALVAAIASGLLFKLLNLLWLSWWVGVPLSLYLADARRRKERRERSERAERAAPGSGGGGGGGSGGSGFDRGGPIVDAEFVSIDEDGGGRARR
ncbi:hypothetical protein Rsub_08938 [Raphidocelis subcapitata]|uniref:Uncharacterized protein n=1 Tax=Raphidocelis subcapitata TaxID=307507 RepID=A0A2V0PAU9_9CHLO|nr:hypothetical protein Rsub_08938 [Raphidocelis subcapitata]|eukprot:GBF96062.1 hypothetical protein Rsub_08938 [Raphidocelis subcapitata]